MKQPGSRQAYRNVSGGSASTLEGHLGVMFVAKQVKVFSRTGTQLSLLACHVGTDTKLQFQEPTCNLPPTGVAATSEQRYLNERKILSAHIDVISLVAKFWGLGKFSTL